MEYNNYIYYCDKCDEIAIDDKDSKVKECTKCGQIMLPTHVTQEKWNAMSDFEKEKKKKEFCQTVSAPYIEQPKQNTTSSVNPIAGRLKTLGIIYLILSIIGCVFIIAKVDIVWGLVELLVVMIFGSLITGIGEIIKLLQEIKDKL